MSLYSSKETVREKAMALALWVIKVKLVFSTQISLAKFCKCSFQAKFVLS